LNLKRRTPLTSAGRYTIYGALFGLAFPLLSLGIIFFVSDNIYFLLGVIGTAPLFLGFFSRIAGRRQDEINLVNEGLELQVENRTRAIRNLLDVSGQGFLSFGSDMKVRGEYSNICETFLGPELAGKPIDALLYEDENKQRDFRDGMSLFFSGKARAEVIFDLMDQALELQGRDIEIIYKTISDEEVLLTLTDVTVQKELDRQKVQEDEHRKIVLQAINHKKYFSSYLHDAEELFREAELLPDEPDREEYHALQRKIHTLKGNASFFSFANTTRVAHDIEYLISDSLLLEESVDVEGQLYVLKKAYYDELSVVENALGREWMRDMDAVTIPLRQYVKLENYVRKKYSRDASLTSAVEHFRKVPFSQMFIRFPDQALRLSETLGKKIHPLEVNGGQFPVLPDRYEKLVNTFVHLLRNMVDHGIETPGERETRNKDTSGNLSIDLEARKGSILISFKDDGGGISFPLIEKKAREKGLLPEGMKAEEKELLKIMFAPEFSTAAMITETSGRGIGLSAVKEEVDRLGGKISVNTKPGQGTEFKILIPDTSLK